MLQCRTATLNESGHKVKFSYKPHTPKKQKKQLQKITWFNAPYNLEVKKNIAARFLKLVTKYFPKSHPLHKIINRHKLKVSYSTTRNITCHINKHNNTVINTQKLPTRWKVSGRLYYQAKVCTNKSLKKYIGSTGRTFKGRYNTHKHTFSNRNANSTTLSSYVWKLKEPEKITKYHGKLIKEQVSTKMAQNSVMSASRKKRLSC